MLWVYIKNAFSAKNYIDTEDVIIYMDKIVYIWAKSSICNVTGQKTIKIKVK